MLWRRLAIIGAALALLTGCSALRMGYGQAPQLAWWWIDGYLDFDRAQQPRVRAALDQWFDWHRQTQLPDYAGVLARLRAEAAADVSPAQVCRWNERLRERIEPALERVLPAAAEIALTLTPAQLQHLEQRVAKANEQFRREQLPPDPAERLATATERLLDRYESFYGRLDDAQRRLVVESAAASPYDPAAWAAEREDRQRELLAALRRIVAERPDPARVQATLRTLARRFDGSAQGALQAQRLRLAQHHCETIARLHNSATAAQRQHLRRKLGGWEGDLRALAAEAAPALAQGEALPRR